MRSWIASKPDQALQLVLFTACFVPALRTCTKDRRAGRDTYQLAQLVSSQCYHKPLLTGRPADLTEVTFEGSSYLMPLSGLCQLMQARTVLGWLWSTAICGTIARYDYKQSYQLGSYLYLTVVSMQGGCIQCY